MAHAQKPDFVFRAKRSSPFKSEGGVSVQSTAGSRGVRISASNDGHTMFQGSVKGTGYPLHSPVSPSLPLPCVTVCHHISTGLCKLKNGKACGHNANMNRLISNPRPSVWILDRIVMTGVFDVCSKGKESLTAGQWSRRVT